MIFWIIMNFCELIIIQDLQIEPQITDSG